MGLRESRRRTIGAVALCLLVASCAARQPARRDFGSRSSGPHRVVVLIGDSTTYGTPENKQHGIQSPYNPAATLEALLATVEPPAAQGGTPWRDALVVNFGVGASTTEHWVETPPGGCGTVLELFPVVKKACAERVSWAAAVPLAVEGGHVDAVIVDLGLNDLLITKDPAETVDRLEQIRSTLAPVPVIFYPPIAPLDGPRSNWPFLVRGEMQSRGLFVGPEYPLWVPTFDGLHPTDGGYAAMGGVWLDGLRKLP